MTGQAATSTPAPEPIDPDELRRRIARTLDDSSQQALQDGVVPKKCGLGAFTGSSDEDEATAER